MYQRPKCKKSETIKLIKQNRGINLCELRSGNRVLEMMSKAQTTKETNR